jgi:hypothetical protein
MKSPVVLFTNYQRTYGKPSLLMRRREPHGRILRLLHEMNGYAGQSPLRSRKLENSMSKGCARNSKRECAGLVVGWAAFTARISQLALRYSMCSTNNLKSHHSGYSSMFLIILFRLSKTHCQEQFSRLEPCLILIEEKYVVEAVIKDIAQWVKRVI